ncbi:competence protein CoiA [Enterococcus saccharolyticus]|uniref:SCAN box domain-containing protein n=1 Tax=Enterococcus saccharolyticus subsp. saccharolyticus ATCC 43076 TaxID=1139996 RepID=S0JPP5_9ENTE|nr:competence protein CoiA family protein [Enterococcus saccharolyticus]EOT29853.1 hypothetical protein OMQ_00543 [Enterococcus saccharolyticus subsp. saccharolyticus ATCC 43076]EOT80400.1 hypothetical protein I572_00925 [Enterococcus saccharolyticus subsp. saccharolyticus ATCC 43076]OJG88247.1 hypothetical protein RV16_GL000350 [Enterococcus saccharolyticus]
MLVAETLDGKSVIASELQQCATKSFICPSCKEAVILKKGRIKIPHFAHTAYAECTSFSEGETSEHLASKAFMQQWSGGQLEAYLPQLKQRPDILLESLAIEVQCSPLSFERYLERTQNYHHHGYQPWWLLGEKLLPRQRWGKLQKAFCYYTKEKGIHIWGIKAQQKEIWLLYAVRWHFRLGYFYRLKKWAFQEQSLEQIRAFVAAESCVFSWNAAEYRYYLQRKLFQDNPQIHQLQQKIYVLGGNLQTLPSWCYQASFYHFFFGDWLLFLRYCYIQTTNFREWLQQLKQLVMDWHYPCISQKEVLQLIYRECQQLEITPVFSK